MPAQTLECDECTQDGADLDSVTRLPNDAWLPVLQRSCGFPSDIFESVSLNLIRNPNINSSLLFRADVLYDSQSDEVTDQSLSENEWRDALAKYNVHTGEFPGFDLKRTIIRRMIPRNPQLDRPVAQTCLFLSSTATVSDFQQTLVIYIPHASDVDAIPWYHPRVQALAYSHSWRPLPSSKTSKGTITLHYRLFPSESLPLSPRLLRTGEHLLSTVHKHGQGRLAGYTKRVNHDQLISQQRVQDRYTELKEKHSKRLYDRWVEKTDPSKHVFEDLGIAAFLIELWKDMYGGRGDGIANEDPSFPGFVDIGCGNGVLVDILLREGYQGWGFDARRRKTWDIFDDSIKTHLKELMVIPQPLLEMQQATEHPGYANGGIISQALFSSDRSASKNQHTGTQPPWHNGIFPKGTFLISNHADELTPWTPLLASISSSPFLAIPCCSHNLSGLRFRAPSVFNNNSADALAPSYFSAHINKNKSIAIAIACPDNEAMFGQGAPEQGDLKDLSAKSRAKQPSAYSSLCDWVAHLAARVGYSVEREMLRLPSTRNVGIVGRALIPAFAGEELDMRRRKVVDIARAEKADGAVWMERARGLTSGNSSAH